MASITQQTHELLASRVRGQLAIDATAGNGYDTEFLARLVGPAGTVWAFDIQAQALQRTAARLRESQITVELRLRDVPAELSLANTQSQVVCIEADHAEMNSHLPPGVRGQIAAIMFNLGYLPGADQSCITRTSSTLAALNAAWEWLASGGVLTVVAYPGHPGGEEEANAVRDWFVTQEQAGLGELLREISPVTNTGPQLWALLRGGKVPRTA